MGPMGGLGIFGDLPQLDPLPAVGGNHDDASHTHDDRVNSFGDLPQLDPLPVAGSNHAEALLIGVRRGRTNVIFYV